MIKTFSWIIQLIALNLNTFVLGIFIEFCLQNYTRKYRSNFAAYTLLLFSLACNILFQSVTYLHQVPALLPTGGMAHGLVRSVAQSADKR